MVAKAGRPSKRMAAALALGFCLLAVPAQTGPRLPIFTSA
jgi:hypothetical protein